MEFPMMIEVAIRRRSGKVVLVPAGGRSVPGVVLGTMIDGSYHGEDVKAVRAALVDDSVSEWQTHRERLGLTQAQLADLLGVTRYAVLKWERTGAEPSAESRRKILSMV
jgi:DNA-binding XRE family transcriptional regulator